MASQDLFVVESYADEIVADHPMINEPHDEFIDRMIDELDLERDGRWRVENGRMMRRYVNRRVEKMSSSQLEEQLNFLFKDHDRVERISPNKFIVTTHEFDISYGLYAIDVIIVQSDDPRAIDSFWSNFIIDWSRKSDSDTESYTDSDTDSQ